MKRTRRIEVIRYSRRVTIVQGDDATSGIHESPVIDITPGARKVAPPAPHEEDRRPAAGAVVVTLAQLRKSAFRLRDLLRRRR